MRHQTRDSTKDSNLSNVYVDLARTIGSANLTNQECNDLATALRRLTTGELTIQGLESFVTNNNASTRAEAFSNLARLGSQNSGTTTAFVNSHLTSNMEIQ